MVGFLPMASLERISGERAPWISPLPSTHTSPPPPALSSWRTLEVGRAFIPTPCPSVCQLPSQALATWEGATQSSLHPSQHLGSRGSGAATLQERQPRHGGRCVPARRQQLPRAAGLGAESLPTMLWVERTVGLSLSRAGHRARCGARCLEAEGGTTGHHMGREGDGER